MKASTTSVLMSRRCTRSVATCVSICGALQLVVSVGDFLAPDVVEVDARAHGEGPPKGDAHAEEWFCAHGDCHADSITNEADHLREGEQ